MIIGANLVLNLMEGTDIQTNNKVMNAEKIGRSVAVWREVIVEFKHN